MPATTRRRVLAIAGGAALGAVSCSSPGSGGAGEGAPRVPHGAGGGPAGGTGRTRAPYQAVTLIGDGSTAHTGPQPNQPVAERLEPGQRPPQFVVFSWDGAGEVGNGLFPRFRKLAADHGATMSFFLSGLYLLPERQKRHYTPPHNPPGASAIGYLTDEHLRATKELVGGRTPCLLGQHNLLPTAAALGWRYDASSPGGLQVWPHRKHGVWVRVAGRGDVLEGLLDGVHVDPAVPLLVRLVSFRQFVDWMDAQDPAVLAKLRTLDVGKPPTGGWREFLAWPS